MARILQDGFETEGKEYDSDRVPDKIVDKMDIGEFIFNHSSQNISTLMSYKSGICSPRGGYGKKGYSIYMYMDNSNTYTCGLKYDLTKHCNNTNELYYRVWIRPRINKTTNVKYTTITALCASSNEFEKTNSLSYANFLKNCNFTLELEMNTIDSYVIRCYCSGVEVYTYNYLYYNEWVKLDVRLKVGDSQTGIFQLRINDKLITTFNGNVGTVNPKYMYIGKPSSSTYNYTEFDVDDIAVNDTTGNVNNSWCGNGSIIGVVPTSNGSKTMFTPGIEGTQNYENVDELGTDGDVTYNSSYALNDIDLFKFTIPDELELSPTNYINAISVVTSAKFIEQPTDIGHIVSDGENESLIGQQQLSNDYEGQFSIIQEKSDGTKYKVSDIENLEFGYKTLESSQAQEE